MQQIIKLVQESKLGNEKVKKHTLLIDDKQQEHGALFFIDVKGKNYKILVPPPHHVALLQEGGPTYQQVLQHKEAMLLK